MESDEDTQGKSCFCLLVPCLPNCKFQLTETFITKSLILSGVADRLPFNFADAWKERVWYYASRKIVLAEEGESPRGQKRNLAQSNNCELWIFFACF